MKKLSIITLLMIWLLVTLPVAVAQDTASSNGTSTPATPIEISNINLIFETERTTFTWSTNIATTSVVDLGRTIGLGNTTTDAALVTNHSVSVPTQSGTEYFYRLTSCDGAGACKVSPTQAFFAGKLFIAANIPRYSKGKVLDITGKTRPGATVSIALNGSEVRKSVTQRGDFLFRDVQLQDGQNNILLRSVLGSENATLSAITEIDSAPASMNVTLTPTATQQPLIVNLSVSEAVNLTVTVKPQGEPPLRPGELRSTDIQQAKVSLKWSEVSNVLEYSVYRDGNRLAIASANEYIDSGVTPGKTYQYQVSAVAKNCVESDKSDLATVATPNGTARPDTFNPVKLSCANEPQQLFVQPGKSSVSVQLREGENLIEFKAVDKANYTTLIEERVVFDTGPPKFVSTNLRQLSPTYQQSISVNGKLNEPGSVTAILNGKPHKTVLTDAEGKFTIPVKLERSAQLQANATRAIGQLVWANKIKLTASDAVGLTAEAPEEQIDFQLCGTGNKIQVELSNPTPQILNPRLLLQGVQTIGMSFKYKYSGGQTATIDKNQIKITPVALSPEVKDQYDNGFVRYSAKPLGVRSLQRGVKNEGTGYVQFTFNPIENPWEQLPELKNEKQPANATTQAKLEAIASHRSGKTKFTSDPTALPQTSGCLIPGFGCMKLFFELEIPFQETTGPLSTDPLVRRTQEDTKTTPQMQRSCLAVEVPIDIPIPPRYIPKGLLQATAEILTAIIEGIDKILKPIETIGKYLFYSCLAGQAVTLLPIFMEKYRCEFSAVFSAATSEGKFNPQIAAIGACEEQYAGQNNDQSRQNCMDCQYWKAKRPAIENVYRQLCDRVMCPSAPSLQYVLKQNANQQLTPISDVLVDTAKQKYPGAYSPDGKFYVGNDCAAWVKSQQVSQPALRTRQPPRLFFTYNQVKGIYQNWLDHKSDVGKGALFSGVAKQQGKINCDELHPAAPECCGFAYMKEWSSACGFSAISMLDTFDEIKESTCLSAEKAGQSSIKLGPAGSPPTADIECGSVLNSIGGFCDPDGSESPHTIKVTQTCCDSGGTATGVRAQTAAAKENYLYLLLLPRKAQTTAPQGATTGEYDVRLGTVQESVEFERSPQVSTTNTDSRHRINANLEAIELPSTEVQAFFTEQKIDYYNQNGQLAPTDIEPFKTALCNAAGYPAPQTACQVDPASVYNEVMAIIGSPDQEYIIRPGDGIVNSLRCVCVPTLIAFLKRWRGILGAVRDCMNSILLTGDGSAGICQAVVSQHACDLLYDAIACFTQKFSKPSGSRGFAGLGNVMGALSATGAELSRSAQSRYGESSIYKQVFVDKKLVHSICLFAFTGTWNLDVDAIFDQAVNEVPTKSYGLVYPCSRRFVGFNPATRPAGLVSWQYEIGAGIAAGSALENVELVLKCSGGFKCRESDGFVRGKCDCETPKEMVINPEGMPSQAKNGEIINEQLFQIIEGAPGDAQIRYDKAYLRWSWNDGKQTRQDKTEECTITTDGGPGNVPDQCRFDPLSLAFRCSLGDSLDGIQFLDAVARPSLNIGTSTPVFALEQAVDVDLKVRQTITDPAGVKGGKLIKYSVKNNQGREVATNEQLLPVNKNGDYVLNVKNDFGASPRVAPSWFGSGGTGQARPYNADQWSSVRNSQVASPAMDMFESITVRQTNDQPLPANRQFQFILEVTADGSQRETYQLFSANSASTRIGDQQRGFEAKSGPLPGSNSGNIQRQISYAGSTATSGQTDTASSLPKIDLTLVRAPIGLAANEKRQYLISYGQASVTNSCDSDAGRVTPQAFSLTYTAYDTDNFGGPTDQVSIDPSNDESVVKTVQFNAICAREGDPALQNKLTSTQTASIGDKLSRILAILEPMVAQQRGAKQTFADMQTQLDRTTPPLTDGDIATIRNQLFRTVAQSVDRYLTTQEQMQTAVRAYQDEYNKLSQLEKDKPYNKDTKARIEEYMGATNVGLSTAATAMTRLRDDVQRLSATPTVQQLKDAIRPAITAHDLPETQRVIDQISGTLGQATQRYQLFGTQNFVYDGAANRPTIIFRDPRFTETQFRLNGVFKTDETPKTSVFGDTATYQIIIPKDGATAILSVESNLRGDPKTVEITQTVVKEIKFYDNNGNIIQTPASPSVTLSTTGSQLLDLTTNFVQTKLRQTTSGVPVTGRCANEGNLIRRCDFVCAAGETARPELSCTGVERCCERPAPPQTTESPVATFKTEADTLNTELTAIAQTLRTKSTEMNTRTTGQPTEAEKREIVELLIRATQKVNQFDSRITQIDTAMNALLTNRPPSGQPIWEKYKSSIRTVATEIDISRTGAETATDYIGPDSLKENTAEAAAAIESHNSVSRSLSRAIDVAIGNARAGLVPDATQNKYTLLTVEGELFEFIYGQVNNEWGYRSRRGIATHALAVDQTRIYVGFYTQGSTAPSYIAVFDTQGREQRQLSSAQNQDFETQYVRPSTPRLRDTVTTGGPFATPQQP